MDTNSSHLIAINTQTGEVVESPAMSHGLLFLEFDPSPTLFVVIPGINDHGEMMLERAKIMFRYGDECLVRICEANRGQICDMVNPSAEQVRQKIIEATRNAEKKGKDVIVNIDMDLEDYLWEFPLPPFINRWNRSVGWAGEMANIVSDAFTKEIPNGTRMLYAHSAGGDATYQSIWQAGQKMKMYDNINILNGRTSADKLRRALERSGYAWRQIKVFTSKGDLPATPALPRLLRLWGGSISNYDAAREWAGKAWVHLHSLTITGHSGLRDGIGVIGTFQVNLGQFGTYDNVVGTVEEMMLRDWRGTILRTTTEGVVSVDDDQASNTQAPQVFLLKQNYPNPFNPETNISFSLPERTSVSLVIYNILGKKVKTLVTGELAAGTHTVHWDGGEEAGNSVASGIYFYRLKTDSFDQTRKMVLMK
jgi:hypothetical protein